MFNIRLKIKIQYKLMIFIMRNRKIKIGKRFRFERKFRIQSKLYKNHQKVIVKKNDEVLHKYKPD